MTSAQFQKLIKENKWAFLMVPIIILLLIFLPYQCISIRDQEWKDYVRLITEGNRVQGKILKHQFFREVSANEEKIRGREGFNVEIGYFDELGQWQHIFETWRSDGKLEPEDLTGEDVIVFYLPDNQIVQAASENESGIRNAMKWMKERKT